MGTSDQQIRSAISQVAADWYMAQRAGPMSEAKRAEFLAWLKASPLHIEEYLGVAALERVLPEATEHPRIPLAALTELARDDPSSSVVGVISESPRPTADTMLIQGAGHPWPRIAAAGIVCIAGVWLLWGTLTEPGHDPLSSYRTAHGVQGTWRLPDGSTLRLDTDTAVTVRFSSDRRLLELDHGQLWVAVAHDDHRPLRVHAGSTQVTAVGTEFDVYRMRASTLITVLTGQVVVSNLNAVTQGTLQVRADQEVRLIDGILPAAPMPAKRRESTAWLERNIVFERRPLGEVAYEFNRYNAVPFTIDDPQLRRMPISGAFDASDTESFVSFLQTLHGVHVERLPTAIQISRPT
jgi:transmembrane sensor